MERKKNWFNLVKKIFGSEKKKKTEKKPPKEKKCRGPWFFGKARLHCPSAIKALPPPLTKTLNEADEEQSKHATAVAIDETGLERSAIKIQAVFRGFLARKALRALKSLVRLQALVRGLAVRKQVTATLKSMQSLIKIQSQICATRVRKAEENLICKERRNDERSSISAITVSEQDNLNSRWSWLQNWEDSQNTHTQNQIAEDPLDSNHTDEVPKTQKRTKEFKKSEQIAGSRSPISLPRNSFHQFRRSLIRDDGLFSSLPALPNYMASTEAAKAKERSVSMPKQRPGAVDTCFDHNSSQNRREISASTPNARFLLRIGAQCSDDYFRSDFD